MKNMKMMLSVGATLALALLSAQTISAQSPCGQVCQAYYPCDYACDLCVGDPGLWEAGGGCWGEIVSGTCGDIGQCGWVPCNPEWNYDEYASYQGVRPEFVYEPCEWVVENGQWVQVCDYMNPYKCTVYGVLRFVRHQNNCPPATSETFCLINNNGSERYIGRYSGMWDWACCNDANVWGCTTSFPQCPNL